MIGFDIQRDEARCYCGAIHRCTAVVTVARREHYHKVGKKVHLKHLSPDCLCLLQNSDKIIDVNMMEDPTYMVMTDVICFGFNPKLKRAIV